MKIYLDTNIISEIVRHEHSHELPALAQVVARGESGGVVLVTSKVTGEEIDRCKGEHGPAIKELYSSMKKIPYVQFEDHVGFDSYWYEEMGGGGSNALYDVNPTWRDLRLAGLDQTDAHHVMLAIRDGCNVFLTLDRRTILSKRSLVQAKYPMQLWSPTEFIAQYAA